MAAVYRIVDGLILCRVNGGPEFLIAAATDDGELNDELIEAFNEGESGEDKQQDQGEAGRTGSGQAAQ